jgi:hypothetical protein
MPKLKIGTLSKLEKHAISTENGYRGNLESLFRQSGQNLNIFMRFLYFLLNVYYKIR